MAPVPPRAERPEVSEGGEKYPDVSIEQSERVSVQSAVELSVQQSHRVYCEQSAKQARHLDLLNFYLLAAVVPSGRVPPWLLEVPPSPVAGQFPNWSSGLKM